jgi:hypothetical protein
MRFLYVWQPNAHINKHKHMENCHNKIALNVEKNTERVSEREKLNL